MLPVIDLHFGICMLSLGGLQHFVNVAEGANVSICQIIPRSFEPLFCPPKEIPSGGSSALLLAEPKRKGSRATTAGQHQDLAALSLSPCNSIVIPAPRAVNFAMVYLKHWSEFNAQAIDLYKRNPDRVS